MIGVGRGLFFLTMEGEGEEGEEEEEFFHKSVFINPSNNGYTISGSLDFCP